MNNNIRNILIEKIILINLNQKEVFSRILHSIKQNNNIKSNLKIYANFILIKKLKKNFILSRSHKICILTGRKSGILKGFSFSRHTIKKLILQNKLTNIKKNNW